MTTYTLIVPEVSNVFRNIGKSAVANALKASKEAQGRSVLLIDESDTNPTTPKFGDSNLEKLHGDHYDDVIIAGKGYDVENAYRLIRRLFYPTQTFMVKLSEF